MSPLLRVEGLYAGYGGAPVLRDVSLRVDAGQLVEVRGAGRTTLVRVLCGLLRPSVGSVIFDGVDLVPLRVEQRVRLGIGCVPQGSGVVGELTVAENLRLGHHGSGGREAIAEVYELFELLADRRGLAAHRLSGGERQMLAIARALVARPRLLLLDEPTAGLAPALAARILALLAARRQTTGLAVLLAAHRPPSTGDSVVALHG